ncbi:MAG: hypothetical protein EA377_14130 [Phycisphaerales bacterium]|nr:MAG: hypothetical protein EA377_14130 [Phycisphaerales bacterium]
MSVAGFCTAVYLAPLHATRTDRGGLPSEPDRDQAGGVRPVGHEWMAPSLLYTISILGAVALYMLLRPRNVSWKIIGTLLGFAAFGWFLAEMPAVLAPDEEGRPGFFYLVFSLISIGCAVRMITHSKPVYSALYFVLIVLSSAAMFLLLAAEFMAFALVIIYAGAILITYMFVLMLAQQSPTADDPTGQPEYDRMAREPAAAAIVGFILLAMLGNMATDGVESVGEPRVTADRAALEAVMDLNLMPLDLEEIVAERYPDAVIDWDDNREAVVIMDDRPMVRLIPEGATSPEFFELSLDDAPGNVQRVGLALVAVFPVSLELAGIILLLAMFGAVVLARRQIELGEDELRGMAGLRKIADYDSSEEDAGEGGGDRA